MAQALLPEDLWSLVAAHLPTHRRSPKGGRPRINDRATLTGIQFVLKTGIPWEWMKAGDWQRIHEAVLRRLREHDQIMWDRACVDAASLPAPAGGEHKGRNPTDRGKLGCKHHLLVDQRRLPLVARISGAQVHDSRFLIPLVEAIRRLKGFPVVRASVQVSCTPIERTLHERIALGYAGEALQYVSRDTALSRVNGSADGVGSMSAP